MSRRIDGTITQGHARMWPRAVFDKLIKEDGKPGRAMVARSLDFLEKPGVYVLYRDDQPYYVGQASKLRRRLRLWAKKPESPYFHFWNFFSAFAVENRAMRDELECILIASMPTANSSKPKLIREPMPKEVADMLRRIYSGQ